MWNVFRVLSSDSRFCFLSMYCLYVISLSHSPCYFPILCLWIYQANLFLSCSTLAWPTLSGLACFLWCWWIFLLLLPTSQRQVCFPFSHPDLRAIYCSVSLPASCLWGKYGWERRWSGYLWLWKPSWTIWLQPCFFLVFWGILNHCSLYLDGL